MQKPTVIYFVRHGLVYDPKAIIYGRLPRYRLDERGRHQAQAAGLALRGQPITQVFSSPLLRARQTAQMILGYHPGLHLHISRLLQEVATPFEGLPRSRAETRRWDLYTGAGPDFESPDLVLARGRRFIALVRRRFAGQQVIAVTHGDVIAFLALWAHGLPWSPQTKERFFPANASISTFIFHTADAGEVPGYRYEIPYE